MAVDTFKPINQTISEIFSCDGIYKIPNYQRQYSWKEEELDALWEDLYEAYRNKTDDNDCYFLGSIVVVNDGKGYFELIDGQQRITTLMILMNVIVKDFPDVNKDSDEIFVADKEKILNCILFQGRKNRLQLQTDPKYDSIFNELIINCETFQYLDEPKRKDLKTDDPQFKYINAAVFFYKKLSELNDKELDEFINYIFYSTNIIKIECTNQSFAIKLFQVLNDRGLELSPSDIVKSYIIGKYDQDDETGKEIFNNNWKNIEDMSKQYGFKIDDFVVFYEYYKLKANPKKQVVDELRDIIQKSDVYELVAELHSYSESLKKVYESNSPIIFSLRYIPWKFYVMTALTSAYQVDYPEKEKLFKEIRRFFYISLTAGCTLTQIKQTSFKLIESIVNKNSIEEIKEDLNRTIITRRMYSKVYDALDNDVYNEKYLKPLMLSLEYQIRENTDKSFYSLDNTLHIDHILPRAFKQNEEWNYIDEEEVLSEINGLGNMALLQDIKNEEALNCGFDRKIRIYKGQDKEGNNKTGITAFEYTRKIIETYEAGNKIWNYDRIIERKKYLISKIEEMLDINRDDINLKITDDKDDGKTRNSKWLYKEAYFDNAKLVRELISDYIKEKNITNYYDIPEQIRNFRMYHHELIVDQNKQIIDNYSYTKVEVNGMSIYVRSICQRENTNDFINMLKKHYNFIVERVDTSENNKYSSSNYLTIDEWVEKKLKNKELEEKLRKFLQHIEDKKMYYTIGTADLHIKFKLPKYNRILIVFMFFGGGELIGFQPSEFYDYLATYNYPKSIADELLEEIKKYLSKENKYTPFENVKGYYYIDIDTFLDNYDEIISLVEKFISNL